MIFSVTFVLICIASYGKYVQTCQAKYKTEYGWSKKYTVDVTFMTGSELNMATRTFKYNSFSVYGIIFWDDDEATVIKLKNFTTCGTEVDKTCITSVFGDLKGSDQDGDEWNICKDDFCF